MHKIGALGEFGLFGQFSKPAHPGVGAHAPQLGRQGTDLLAALGEERLVLVALPSPSAADERDELGIEIEPVDVGPVGLCQHAVGPERQARHRCQVRPQAFEDQRAAASGDGGLLIADSVAFGNPTVADAQPLLCQR
jgi:hypothetical protein